MKITKTPASNNGVHCKMKNGKSCSFDSPFIWFYSLATCISTNCSAPQPWPIFRMKNCGALFADLSKAFDCLQHDLLPAKLNACGFDYKYLKLISSFASNRKYRTKINSSFSEWKHVLIGVPQGSVLDPSLFTIYSCHLFLFMSESNVANHADDTVLYAHEKNYKMRKES